MGEAIVPIQYQTQQATRKMVVVDALSKPAILGRNWMHSIQLDWQSIFKVQSQPVDIVETFPELFKPRIGTLRGYKANITLREGATPKFYRPRPVPYALQQPVEDELSRLQAEGILQLMEQSERATPLVVVFTRSPSILISR